MKKASIFFAFFLIMSIGTLIISQEHALPKKRTIPRYLSKDEILTVELYNKSLPTVVTVYTRRQVFTEEGPQYAEALGSGVLISPECHVLTAAHVVDGADQLDVKTFDEMIYQAELLFSEPRADIALIRLINPPDLKHAKLGDSDKLAIGQRVFCHRESLWIGVLVLCGLHKRIPGF